MPHEVFYTAKNLLTSCNSTSAEKVKPVPTVGDYDVPNLKAAAPSAFVEKVSKLLSRKLFARRNKQLKANVHGFFKNPFRSAGPSQDLPFFYKNMNKWNPNYK